MPVDDGRARLQSGRLEPAGEGKKISSDFYRHACIQTSINPRSGKFRQRAFLAMNRKGAKITGFREIEHTADWELEVWAPDMSQLLEQSARGMYALSGTRLIDEPRQKRVITLEALDAESLLVSFLTELLYLAETENLAFDEFQLELFDHSLHAQLGSAPIASQDKEIKAVTFHRMEIRAKAQGLQVNIVFDV
jgi:SHS2 domain-containing protein